MTSFATNRATQPTRAHTPEHDTSFRKDTHMFSAEIRLADIREQHEQHRSIRHAERHGSARGRSIRLRLGESLMRLGRRVGGDALSDGRTDVLHTPAWQG